METLMASYFHQMSGPLRDEQMAVLMVEYLEHRLAAQKALWMDVTTANL